MATSDSLPSDDPDLGDELKLSELLGPSSRSARSAHAGCRENGAAAPAEDNREPGQGDPSTPDEEQD